MVETNTASYLKGLHILAVDDEKDILDTIEDVLDEAHVDRAEDYYGASKKLQETKYDLAILDIMGVNGLELLVETVNKGIPAVILTAHAMSPEALKASVNKGALSYLPKEELPRLDEFLGEIWATHQKGGPTWKLLFQRMGSLFEKRFGRDWMSDDPEFWNDKIS